MSISTMEGDNIKEIVVRIVPKDTNIPPTKLTVITFLCILYFIHFIIFEHDTANFYILLSF